MGVRSRPWCARRSPTPTIDADRVDHINAHGTATPQNDRAEARGFRAVFGDRAARTAGDLAQVDDRPLPGRGRCARSGGPRADGGTRQVIPPTINHAETDRECAVDVVANEARDARVAVGVSTSLAFGGNDSALVITAV